MRLPHHMSLKSTERTTDNHSVAVKAEPTEDEPMMLITNNSSAAVDCKPFNDDTEALRRSANSQSLFLKLPGELRNRIYEFATEDCTREFVLRSYKRGYSELCVFCARATTDTVVKRQYYSLTQVCHQIRNEYLPLYRARTETYIRLDDINEYINSIIVVPGSAASEAIGKVVVISETCDLDAQQPFDLLALAKQAQTAPGFSIAMGRSMSNCNFMFNEEYSMAQDFVNPLWNSARYPQLRAYVDEAISAIVWEKKSHYCVLRIRMKKGSEPPFRSDRWPPSDDDEAKRRLWLTSLGLQVSTIGSPLDLTAIIRFSSEA
ncbi:hypothetical protein NX059_012013 [Plenodomus lindquistii]|nr:hypothetical protein NX059_012013 [Plenodomus lindquistii]